MSENNSNSDLWRNPKYVVVSYIEPPPQPKIKKIASFKTEKEATEFVSKNNPKPGYQNIVVREENIHEMVKMSRKV